jgi:inward rectifier potassium channel
MLPLVTLIETQPAQTRTNSDDDPNRDLGFGAVVARDSRKRLLNRDGSFNVVREGLSFLQTHSPYQFLLTTSWPRFLGLIIVFYLATNSIFAAAFVACGPGEIAGATATSLGSRLLEMFFFSVQTFATIGYGGMHPVGLAANVLVTAESLVGLLGFALATGILFARFSQPMGKILFSDNAIIAPYHGSTAFEFRIANARSNELIEVEVRVMLSRLKPDGNREFLPLRLEREKVVIFPLTWTIVHPIDEDSPLSQLTHDDLIRSDAEFLILLSGMDATFSQKVHKRSSYKANEILWGVRFANLFGVRHNGVLSGDVKKVSYIENTPPPAT